MIDLYTPKNTREEEKRIVGTNVVVVIARIHDSMIAMHWSHTNGRKKRKISHIMLLDKIKQKKRKATVDMVIPDVWRNLNS